MRERATQVSGAESEGAAGDGKKGTTRQLDEHTLGKRADG
jgi:hypothetical protein